jgi:hypothetical protein
LKGLRAPLNLEFEQRTLVALALAHCRHNERGNLAGLNQQLGNRYTLKT